MPDPASLDWIAILVCTFVAGGLGAVWYSPLLFGPAWMAEIGLTKDDTSGPAGRELAGSVLSCFVASVAMAILLSKLGAVGWGPGLYVGATIGLGIVAMTMLSDALFSGWSLRLYLIQTGYRALYVALIGTIQGEMAG